MRTTCQKFEQVTGRRKEPLIDFGKTDDAYSRRGLSAVNDGVCCGAGNEQKMIQTKKQSMHFKIPFFTCHSFEASKWWVLDESRRGTWLTPRDFTDRAVSVET